MGIFKLSLVINYVSSPVLEQWKRTGANEMNILYIPKITNANTSYREISENDKISLQFELIKYLVKFGELSSSSEADTKWIMQNYWLKKSSLLPRGRNGQNSPYSFISGVLGNIMIGTQKDLTELQCDALEQISRLVSVSLEGFEEITFQVSIF
jgi:hypothetical protein